MAFYDAFFRLPFFHDSFVTPNLTKARENDTMEDLLLPNTYLDVVHISDFKDKGCALIQVYLPLA